MGKKNKNKNAGDSAAGDSAGAPSTSAAAGAQGQQPAPTQQPGTSQSGNVPSSQSQGKKGGQQGQKQGAGDGWGVQGKQQRQKGDEQKQSDPQQHQGQQKKKQGDIQKQQSATQLPEQWGQSKENQQKGGQQKQKPGPQQAQQGSKQGKQQQEGQPEQQKGTQQGQRGPEQGQGSKQGGEPRQQGPQQGPPQGQRQQAGPQQGQRGPQQQGGPQQSQWGAPQGQQQQGQRGPPQGQQQQQQGGSKQGQSRAPQGQQQQGGPQQGQWGSQQQGGPQQSQWGAPQGQQQQGQWGPPQGQQQHGGPQQGQRGPPQGQQHQGQQQQGQRGPPQGQQQYGGPQQGQRGPPQGQQHQGQQQQGQRGPPQGQQQYGGPQQGQRGPPQGQQHQSGPQQGQWGPQKGQQQQTSQQRQQGGPQQGGQQRPQGSQQGQRGPPQGLSQQQRQQTPDPSASSSTQSVRSSSTTSSTSSLSAVSKGNIPRGTQGRPGTVEVNYLDIDLDKMPGTAYHYDVVITPDRPKKFIRPAFEQFNRQFFPNIAMAYDGRASVYTIEKLLQSPFEGEIQLDDSGSRKITFKIAVKETMDMEIDLNSLRNYFKERIFDKPMRALQCLEVVLSNPCHEKGVRVGRSFFRQPENYMDLGDGFEMWTGLYQAAILGDSPFLNVDISNKSFPSECKLIDYIRQNFRDCNPNQPLDRYKIQDLKSFLSSINIVYEPPACFGSFARTYKVIDVSDQSADRLMFRLEDGTQMSVAQYFNSKGYPLKFPALNCLQVGSTVKKNYLPLELCKIPPGQALNKKDGRKQVQKMIRYAATSTNIRKAKIMSMLSYFEHNRDVKIQKFGIRIGNAFKVVPMRLLKSPSVEYYSCELISPFKGAWRMNPNSKFLDTKQISNGFQWAVIYSKKSRISFSTLQRFAGMVYDLSKKLNMTLAPKPEIITFENVMTTLRDLKGKKYDLVFVVIRGSRFGTSYADIKQAAELKVGQLTQCILENTIEQRCDVQTVSNILLKVNGKLNGTNHKINDATNIPLKNVMFLGADVTHPSPDQKHIPSVVGVAASHDKNGACYNMQYRLQKSTVENIEDMDSIFVQHMNVYFNRQGRYPDHIIYYRDGVSDGQFPIVKRNELRDIRAACTKLRCSPKITCIVVVKRHHTRFFPQTVNPRDKFNNVEPGTVVDKLIVHPNEVEFFMVSHQSIQGTAKPTRYNVILDEAKMNIDDLQKLTYNLCHMFPRCNRVVSYPAPAYLAHLVAFRGRVYIDGTRQFAEPKKEYEKRLVNTDFMKSNPMYFI